jgi:hypothetical protein
VDHATFLVLGLSQIVQEWTGPQPGSRARARSAGAGQNSRFSVATGISVIFPGIRRFGRENDEPLQAFASQFP